MSIRYGRLAVLAAAMAPIAALAISAPATADTPQPPTIVSGKVSAPGKGSRATCPDGTQLTGGGYVARYFTVNGNDDPSDALIGNTPVAPNSWAAGLKKGTVQAYAMCVKSDSPPPQIVHGPLSEVGGWSTATCPDGTQLAGGGFLAPNVASNGYGAVVATEIANAPDPTKPNTWEARWIRGAVTATAMCVK